MKPKTRRILRGMTPESPEGAPPLARGGVISFRSRGGRGGRDSSSRGRRGGRPSRIGWLAAGGRAGAAILLVTVLMTAVSLSHRAQADPAVVHNFDAAEAGISGPVWAIAEAVDGTLFVGSNRLSLFDGTRWKTLPVGKAYAFRALAAETVGRRGDAETRGRGEEGRRGVEGAASDAARVWVGAVGAIGYVEKQSTGRWEFVSLDPHLRAAGVAHPGDVWHVHAVPDGAIFTTTDRVLRWSGTGFATWPLPAVPHLLAFPGRTDLFVYQNGRGLWRMPADRQPRLELADGVLPARPLTWLSPLRTDADPTGFTALAGLGADAYRLSGRIDAGGALHEPRFERLDSLTSALRDLVPTFAEWIDDEVLAIGTYRAGVLLVDANGRVLGRIDRGAGLDDDNVTALRADRGGRLWVGHGSGFARIDGVARAALFEHRRTLGSGVPRAVLALDGSVHVLTSRGFFRADVSPSEGAGTTTRFVPRLEAQGMLHAAAVVDGEIWIGGFGGMWRVTAAGVEQEYFSATDVVQIAVSEAEPGAILFIEGYELKLLRRTERGWSARSLEARVHDTPVSLLDVAGFAPGAPGSAWISTMAEGIHRFDWTAGREPAAPVLRPAARFQEGRGLPPGAGTGRLGVSSGRMQFFSDSGVLMLRPDQRGFEPVRGTAELDAVVATATGVGIPPQGSRAFWLARARALAGHGAAALLRVDAAGAEDGMLVLQPLEAPGLDRIGHVTGAEVVHAGGKSFLWIVGTEGILRLEVDRLQEAAPPPGVQFVRVTAGEADRPLRAGAAEGEPRWPAKSKRVSFSYAAPGRADGDAIFFQTRLRGIEAEWSLPARSVSREFTGLHHGSYDFEVRALDRFGRAGPPAGYPFTIMAPWFLRWPALAAYVAAAAAAAGLLLRWRMVRLRRQNEKLNRLVAERTRELELSSTVRAEFLENVSHEIRNPLNGLNGLLGLLQQADLPPRERELMASLQVCARNLNRTYEEVLGFSKLEYGYITKDERRFSLGTLLREIVGGFAWQAGQQGCRISIEEEGGAAEIDAAAQPAGARNHAAADAFIGDENKLRTIVTNFVANALKYAPRQPVEIKVEQHPIDEASVSVCIEVCDHGPGIPTEEQGLIFQKFVRGTNAKSGQVAGTGLGLATCRVMAKALGGSIGVESEPGRGSVFFVRIPLRRAVAPGGGAPDAPAAAEAAGEGVRRGAALLVEDEPYNQTVLRGIMMTLGYEAAVASDAREAAALLDEGAFDVILLDWELPGLKGGEIARRVRLRRDGERPVIIATTGHDSDEMRRQCHAAGMDDFLLKPYDLEAIRHAIARVLHARDAGTAGDDSVRAPNRRAAGPRPAGPGPAGALNLRAFEHYAAGAPEKAQEAAREFVHALDRELAALERCVRARDGDQVAQYAHRVCALGGLLGAGDFTDAARQLERLAHAGSDEQRSRALRALVGAAELLKRRLASRHPAVPAASA
jgi:signal transduction histidine kinase/CheY-like chemotaxis protein